MRIVQWGKNTFAFSSGWGFGKIDMSVYDSLKGAGEDGGGRHMAHSPEELEAGHGSYL